MSGTNIKQSESGEVLKSNPNQIKSSSSPPQQQPKPTTTNSGSNSASGSLTIIGSATQIKNPNSGSGGSASGSASGSRSGSGHDLLHEPKDDHDAYHHPAKGSSNSGSTSNLITPTKEDKDNKDLTKSTTKSQAPTTETQSQQSSSQQQDASSRKGRRRRRCCCWQKRSKGERGGGASGNDPDDPDGTNPGGLDDGEEDHSPDSKGCLGSDSRTEANNLSNTSKSSTRSSNNVKRKSASLPRPPGQPRRTRVPDRPNYSFNVWSILKNSIGKELSKIPMPVNFSEPLSMLQRLTEDYEYAELLDRASRCTDSTEQMCFVAAFSVSSYATTAVRTFKPFNPLLGETYECDRSDDRGWRSLAEQVSHHPPTASVHCAGKGWICYQEFTMTSRFKGNYLEVIPQGMAHIHFEASGNHYTWRKVTTVVHNIIVGKLWIDQDGEMTITNHKTGDTCQIKYIPYSVFAKKQKEVNGSVFDKDQVLRWTLFGSWDSRMDANKVKAGTKSRSRKSLGEGDTVNLWVCRPPQSGSEKYYNFTTFACQLNELEAGIPPTDSRLRPDQRLMEEGRWDDANAEKLRLEDKQRTARKTISVSGGNPDQQVSGQQTPSGYRPTWFRRETDPYTMTPIHKFNGQYWSHKQSKDWKSCPDIF